MTTNIEHNKEIMKKNLLWHRNLPLDDISKAMDDVRAAERAKQDATYKIHEKYHELNDKDIEDKARANEREKIINAIWTWWNARPQHLFATPLDIEELVNIIKKVD